MELLSLFEYETTQLTVQEKEFLEQNYCQEKKLFSFTARGIKAKQFVGVCQVNDKLIEVLPKIFKKGEQDKKKSRQLFLRLLKLTGILDVEETEIAHLTKEYENILEVLIYLFAKKLLELLQRGVFKSYIDKQENLPYLRGKLNIVQHIKYNSFAKQHLFCEYSEFTENNLMNQIFKSCVRKLLLCTSSSNNFSLLKRIDLILDDVEFIRFRKPAILKRVKFHRLNKAYENLFRLAGIFLFNQGYNLEQNNFKSFSFMFDMNKLFEKSVFVILKKYK